MYGKQFDDRTPVPRPRSRLALPLGLVVSVLLCLFAPLAFSIPAPIGGNVTDANAPILSHGHLLGTDTNGNDVASRLVYGGQTSLFIAFSASLLGLSLGGLIGASAGYFGGTVDALVVVFIDSLLAIPGLILVLAAVQVLEPSRVNIAIALSLFTVPGFTRVARSATVRLTQRSFMIAARLYGTSAPRSLLIHIAPNIFPQLLTFGVLSVGGVIILEGALSFLGFGIRLPAASWGGMIYQGEQTLSVTPRLALLPCGALFITVLSFDLLSQALRDFWRESVE